MVIEILLNILYYAVSMASFVSNILFAPFKSEFPLVFHHLVNPGKIQTQRRPLESNRTHYDKKSPVPKTPELMKGL